MSFGFVVARDLDYLRSRFQAAFLNASATDMEKQLNAVGVPAARVRKLGEFLREVDGQGKITLPDFRFDQDGREVRRVTVRGWCLSGIAKSAANKSSS